MKRSILLIVTVAILAAGAIAQTKLTENTLTLAKDQKGAAAKISLMGWLAGNWQGEGLGAFVEETYSAPRGGTMIGMFRMVEAEKPVFYEMMTIFEDGGTLMYRLKHYDPKLVGWEEKDKSVDFAFIKHERNRFYFDGMTFENAGRRKMVVYVAIAQKDGTVKEEAFRYTRTK